MMRTVRLRDGSLIRVALWRDAASGRISLALEAEFGSASEPAALVAAVGPPRLAAGATRLVLRPPAPRPAPPMLAGRPARPALLRLAPPPPRPMPLGAGRAGPLRLARTEAPRPSRLAASLAALRMPAPQIAPRGGGGGDGSARALHPSFNTAVAIAPPAQLATGSPPTSVYDAAFLLGPIAG